MATAQRASGTTPPRRSARAGRKRGWIPWQSPLTQLVEGGILTGFWAAGITRRLEVHDPFLQTLLRQGQSPRQTPPSTFPITVIPKALHPYLFTAVEGHRTAKRLEVDRYEFLGYRLLRNALEAGDVYVQESTEFRRFEDDLISDTRWQHKDAVLREIGAPIVLAPIDETLAAFRDTLDAKFKAVNQRIEDGTNTHIKVTVVAGKRRWRLRYPSEEDAVNSPFYSQLPGIGSCK